jgi:hypothetical protein
MSFVCSCETGWEAVQAEPAAPGPTDHQSDLHPSKEPTVDDSTARNPGRSPDLPQDEKKDWTKPEITDLPRLTDLTLQTGSPIGGGGGTGGGGSTVF